MKANHLITLLLNLYFAVSLFYYTFFLTACSPQQTPSSIKTPNPPLSTATTSTGTNTQGSSTTYSASIFADFNQINVSYGSFTLTTSGYIKGLSVSNTGKVYASLGNEGILYVFNRNYDHVNSPENYSFLPLCDPNDPNYLTCNQAQPYPTLYPGMLDLINKNDPSVNHKFVFIVSTNNAIYTYTTSAQVLIGGNVFGYLDGTLPNVQFKNPNAVRANKLGTRFYISDLYNYVIRRLDISSNTLYTYAGTYNASGSSEGGVGTGQLNNPQDLVLDSHENLYLVDQGNSRIRKVSYVSPTGGGILTTFAGNGNSTITNGIGTAASVGIPESIAIDNDQYLYVTEALTTKIMKISLTNQQVTTLTILDPNNILASNSGQGKIAVDTSLTPYVIYILNYTHPTLDYEKKHGYEQGNAEYV